jgi:F-type H+-transporting ATPase subunit epsilon
MSSFLFSLVSPEKVLLEREVSQVVIPGKEGNLGVLPGHAPLLTLLRPGVITIYEGDKILIRFFVDGGFCEITTEKCVALVTEGVPLASLDKETLEIEVKNLLEDLADSKTAEERLKTDRDLNIAQAKLMEVLTYKEG